MAMESGRRKACEKAGVAVEDKLRETMVSILRARGPSKTWSVHEKKKTAADPHSTPTQPRTTLFASRSLTIMTTLLKS